MCFNNIFLHENNRRVDSKANGLQLSCHKKPDKKKKMYIF